MRIFITGATGVVGRRLLPLLLAQGHRLTAIGRTQSKRAMLEELGVEPIDLDLFSPLDVSNAVAGHDTVINLATSIPSTYRLISPGAWRENDRLRRNASRNLAEASIKQGVSTFIQESFALIYQDNGHSWIDETSPIQPSRHTRSILDAERAAIRVTENGGLGVALRFGLFYGPDSAQTLETIRAVRRGIAMMPGPGDRYLPSLSHDDAAAAVLAALKVEPGVYNVVDDEPLPKRTYFASLAEALGVRPPALLPGWSKYLLGSVGETISRSLRISNWKFCAQADWNPAVTSAREGWRSVVEQIAKDSTG